MSMFQVNASEMQSTITQLKSDNQEFMKRVEELNNSQQELSKMWKGDSNTAFNAAYASDATQWTNFYNLVNEYIETLNSMLKIYKTVEEVNTETASNRTY